MTPISQHTSNPIINSHIDDMLPEYPNDDQNLDINATLESQPLNTKNIDPQNTNLEKNSQIDSNKIIHLGRFSRIHN